MERHICLCIPCILHYIGTWKYPITEHDQYPTLRQKGFTKKEHDAIAYECEYATGIQRQGISH